MSVFPLHVKMVVPALIGLMATSVSVWLGGQDPTVKQVSDLHC